MFTISLPSGKAVSVKPPQFSDRQAAVKEYRPVREQVGYGIEELMAAKAIVAIDGQPIRQNFTMDPAYLMNEWSNMDVQYYIEVFMTAFFMDERLKERAQEEAKKLAMEFQMATQNAGQPSSVPSPAKVPAQAT